MTEPGLDQKTIHTVLLAYCFVIFGVVSGLNTQTVLQNFLWFGSGGHSFPSIIADLTFNNIEVWYLLAGILFFVIHPIFMGFFLYSYVNEKIGIKTRAQTILEFFYLSLVGGFSIMAVHFPRIILTYLANINPEYRIQQEFLLTKYAITMEDWQLFTYDIPPETMSIGIYSIVAVFGYFIVIYLLYFWRRKITKNLNLENS